MEKKWDGRRDVVMTDVEALVPKDHLLRKVEKRSGRVSSWVRLKFAACNLKKLALWWARYSFPCLPFTVISLAFSLFPSLERGFLTGSAGIYRRIAYPYP